MKGIVRVLIADDHTMVRESLVSVLQADGDVQVVAQAADGIEAIEQAELTRPDVVVADLSMPRLGGVEVVRRLREKLPGTRVLVRTMHLTARVREVLHLIAEGLTTKEIARKLDISVKAAENHRGGALDKLDVRNTAELVPYALRKGLLD